MREAAFTPRAQASCVGRIGRLVPPSATFVRHSPGRATRSIAPTTCPAATTSRRSRPTGGTSSWIKAPCFVNQDLELISSSVRATSSLVSQRKTSVPQLPNRGLTTTGGPIPVASPGERTCSVFGCGMPASTRSRVVRSLSCAFRSASAPLMTRTPSRSSSVKTSMPGCTPSSDRQTADDQLDARFAFDVASVCSCIVLAVALGAATLRRRTG